jgi:hypothetical protein
MNLVSDLLTNIQVLSDTDPDRILKFFIHVSAVYELKLVSDLEFMSLLVSRTSGRIMQMLETHLGTTNGWGEVWSSIISTPPPHPRLKEKFLMTYIQDRFQSSSEDLNIYISCRWRRQIYWDFRVRSPNWFI